MKTLLQHKSLRKTFLITVGLILVGILITKFFILPNFEPHILPSGVIPEDSKWFTIVSSILDITFILLAIILFIGLFLFYNEILKNEKKFEIVESIKIRDLIEKERNDTEIWYFTGGVGRFTRSSTIPEIAKIAQNTNQHKCIKLQIIDPTDESTCLNYANFRNEINPSIRARVWDKEFVRHQCIATIVSAIIHKCNYPLLDLSICLKNSFSTLRIDLSSKIAIITKEDPKEPALVCKEGSYLYKTYKEEILQTFKEYKSVNTSINFPYKLLSLTKENVKEIILNLKLGDTLLDQDYQIITKIIKSKDKPY